MATCHFIYADGMDYDLSPQTDEKGFDIKINTRNYDNDTLVIGYYMGNKTLARDTLKSKGKGVFHFEGEEALEPGVYMLLKKPDNSFVQFFVNEKNQDFEIDWDVKSGDYSFKGSKDNDVFKKYMNYLDEKRGMLESINTLKQAAKNAGRDTLEYDTQIDALDEEVRNEQLRIIKENPGTISALFLKSTQSTPVPEYEGPEMEVQQKQFEFFRKHYFDYLELGNPASLRTPFFDNRIDYFVERMTYQIPDSIIVTLDNILTQMEPAPETYRYYLSTFLNTYANKKIIGMDAVYVYLVDNYYTKGKAPWVKEDVLAEIVRGAESIKNTLIGKTFPSIITYTADGEAVDINAIKADYKVVIFWAHTCPHCKKTMPDVVQFQKEFADKNVKTITVCTKARDKADECMAYVAEHDMENLLNTYDPAQKFRRKIEVRTTPKVFILDSKNEILLKDLGPDKLSVVLPQIMEASKTSLK